MVDMCRAGGHTVARIMLQNELTWRSRAQVDAALDRIWQVMQDCVSRGCGINYPEADSELPGPLKVRRRAPELYRSLTQRAERTLSDPLRSAEHTSELQSLMRISYAVFCLTQKNKHHQPLLPKQRHITSTNLRNHRTPPTLSPPLNIIQPLHISEHLPPHT